MSSPDIFLIWTVVLSSGLIKDVMRTQTWFGLLEDPVGVLCVGLNGVELVTIVIGIESISSWAS